MKSLRRTKPRNNRLLLPSLFFNFDTLLKEKKSQTKVKTYLDKLFKNSLTLPKKTNIKKYFLPKNESFINYSSKTPIDLTQDLKKSFSFTLEQLLILKTIAISGSFKQTADLLFLSQPAVSLQVKKLENQLNLTLIERKRKSLQLTFLGTIFLSYIDRILFLCDEISKVLAESENFQTKFISTKQKKNVFEHIELSLKQTKKNITLSTFKVNNCTYLFSELIPSYEKTKIKKEYLLKKARNLLEIQTTFDLQIYTLENVSLFFLQTPYLPVTNKFSFLKKLKTTKFILLTDNIFIPTKIYLDENSDLKKIMESSDGVMEVSTIEALKFCLSTKLGNAFMIENSIIKTFFK